MKIIIISCVIFLLNRGGQFTWAAEIQIGDSLNEDVNLEEVNRGVYLVTNAFRTLINGEPKAESYKDLFVDTSKSLLDHLEKGIMNIQFQIPVDDMLTILVQTIIILVANRRVDLIPSDFNGMFLMYTVL